MFLVQIFRTWVILVSNYKAYRKLRYFEQKARNKLRINSDGKFFYLEVQKDNFNKKETPLPPKEGNAPKNPAEGKTLA